MQGSFRSYSNVCFSRSMLGNRYFSRESWAQGGSLVQPSTGGIVGHGLSLLTSGGTSGALSFWHQQSECLGLNDTEGNTR